MPITFYNTYSPSLQKWILDIQSLWKQEMTFKTKIYDK